MKIKLGESVVTKNAKETMKVAKAFAKTLAEGDIVLLRGDLGAGKTVFAKGFVKGRNIKADVVSPTFTIMNYYGEGKVVHYDLYRLDSLAEFEAFGGMESLFLGGVKLVEWPEKIGLENFPENVYTALIEKNGDEVRKITIKKGK